MTAVVVVVVVRVVIMSVIATVVVLVVIGRCSNYSCVTAKMTALAAVIVLKMVEVVVVMA